MVLAADYPFLDVFWTMILFFSWVIWIWMMVVILSDVFRRRDIGGWAKAAWVIFMLVLPFLGVLVYLIANHDGINERRAEDSRAAQAQFDDRVRAAAQDGGSGGAAGEIEKAKALFDSGAITEQEFAALKAKAIA
jgi:Phospholipase_D-nuclease N-terminal/Short C-terminal domain